MAHKEILLKVNATIVAFSLRNSLSQAFSARFFSAFNAFFSPILVLFLSFPRVNVTVFHTKCNLPCYCCIYFENLRKSQKDSVYLKK